MDHHAWLASSLSYVYVDPPNSNLLCCICRMPFVKPTTSTTCAHSFCHDCIGPALQSSSHCPIDRSPLSPQDMAPSNPIVRHMVDELIVECLNRPNGCEFTCQRHLLAAHLKGDCLFVEAPCPDPECPQKALRKDILRNDIPRCPHCLIICDGCGTEMKAAELGSHNRVCSTETVRCPSCNGEHLRSETSSHPDVCPASIVPCEHAAHGCSWTGPRSTLQDTHTPQCPYAALEGFFRISDARAAALETENVRLRARLDAAEGMLAVMRHELQAIKGALGPWSPDVDSSPPTPYTQAALSPQPPATTTTAANHNPFSHQRPPRCPVPVAGPNCDCPYRPRGLLPPPTSDASLNGPPSPTTTNSTVNGGAGLSLSATLTALRSALQTHDARARMSASAHAAELGAIRQVVAGLRMQLHAVLMELSNAGNAGADGWTPLKLPAAARFFLPGLVPPPPPPAVSITKL
ncbi:hypothetical protein EI94DRAFT_1751624 [Lactarius quietus]|nr:hypothetical protein EI94DRAFT_1751624 [Lactarius quietus]